MKAATSELTLTLIAIVAIGGVLLFVNTILKSAEEKAEEEWNNTILND